MSETPQALSQLDHHATRRKSTRSDRCRFPLDAYWGIHTARALENFPITRRPISVYPDLIRALARVKQAAARANKELGVLDAAKADMIDRVCEEIVGGALHDQFCVGVIQGGAGTSTNMNTNEVIANRALELDGPQVRRLRAPAPDRRGEPQPEHERRLPDRDQARAWSSASSGCSPSTSCCTESFAAKGVEFANILKVGPHPVAGCRADDARAGVPRLRAHPGRGLRPAQRDRSRGSTRSTWAPPRSAPASPPTRGTPRPCAATWSSSPAWTWSPPPTSSRPPRTPGSS